MVVQFILTTSMKKRIIILLSIIISIFTSCGSSQLYQRGGMTYNINKGGVWGSWTDLSYTGDEFLFQYNKTIYTLINYSHSSHPSEYKYKIELVDNQQLKSKDGWYDYQGKITCLSVTEYLDGMLKHYKTPKRYIPFEDAKGYEEYYIFSCTVKCNKKISEIVKKGHGTINVIYNGVGRAWNF